MRKFACILGVLLSIGLIALGVLVALNGLYTVDFVDGVDFNGLNFSGTTVTSTTFGADFYTYSYRGTRAAANNLDSLGDYLEGCAVTLGSLALVVGGLFGLLLSMYGLGVNKAMKQELALLDQISRKPKAAPAASGSSVSAAGSAASAPAASAEPSRKAAPEKPSFTIESTWACQKCGHVNSDSHKSCDLCGEKKPGVHVDSPSVREAAPVPMPAAPVPEAAPAPEPAPAPMPFLDALAELEPAAAPVQREEKPAPAAEAEPAMPDLVIKPAARPASGDGSWTCPVCAMENAAEQPECVCCGEKKPGQAKLAAKPAESLATAAKPAEAPAAKNAGEWRCGMCGMYNDAADTVCMACGKPKR